MDNSNHFIEIKLSLFVLDLGKVKEDYLCNITIFVDVTKKLWWWRPGDQITKAHTNTCIVVGDTTPNSYWMGWMEVSSSSSATALQCIPALLVLSKKAFSHNYFVFYVLLLHHLLGWYTHPMYTMIFFIWEKIRGCHVQHFYQKVW